jgi:serine/threonine-protein kinase
MDEARVMARIRHPNVASVLDVFLDQEELFVVMEYIPGETLGRLLSIACREGKGVDPALAVTVICDVLDGLHAAHSALSSVGERLSVVHRDVSPQNILVGTDGLSRVLDFGIAKARGRMQWTHPGTIKGKLSYMAPEQILSQTVDHRADLFAAAGVLWESLTGQRLHGVSGTRLADAIERIVPPPSELVQGISPALDRAVMRGLEKNPELRWPSAEAFALALEDAVGRLPSRKVRSWLADLAARRLETLAQEVGEIERTDVMSEVLPNDAPLVPLEIFDVGIEQQETKKDRAPAVEGLLADDPPASAGPPQSVQSAGQDFTEAIAVTEWQEHPPVRTPIRLSVKAALAAAALLGVVVVLLVGRPKEPAMSTHNLHVMELKPISVPSPDSSREIPDEPTHVYLPNESDEARPVRTKPRGATIRRDCKVPYWIDASGIRRLKQQCL